MHFRFDSISITFDSSRSGHPIFYPRYRVQRILVARHRIAYARQVAYSGERPSSRFPMRIGRQTLFMHVRCILSTARRARALTINPGPRVASRLMITNCQ